MLAHNGNLFWTSGLRVPPKRLSGKPKRPVDKWVVKQSSSRRHKCVACPKSPFTKRAQPQALSTQSIKINVMGRAIPQQPQPKTAIEKALVVGDEQTCGQRSPTSESLFQRRRSRRKAQARAERRGHERQRWRHGRPSRESLQPCNGHDLGPRIVIKLMICGGHRIHHPRNYADGEH